MRLNSVREHPHKVVLPKGSVSPTGSIYKEFDIVEQTLCLISTMPRKGQESRTIRCAAPFVLRISVNGKIRELKSKL